MRNECRLIGSGEYRFETNTLFPNLLLQMLCTYRQAAYSGDIAGTQTPLIIRQKNIVVINDQFQIWVYIGCVYIVVGILERKKVRGGTYHEASLLEGVRVESERASCISRSQDV